MSSSDLLKWDFVGKVMNNFFFVEDGFLDNLSLKYKLRTGQLMASQSCDKTGIDLCHFKF